MDDKLIEALDLAEKGEWDASHTMVQQMESPLAMWLHANLHREEGDLSNAGYWYSRCGREPHSGSIEQRRGNSFSRARACTAATLVSATSAV